MGKNIGRVQYPDLISPDTLTIFDIDKFIADDQSRIALSNPKPIFLRPQLRNSALRFDNLKLSQMLSAELHQMSCVKPRDEQSQIMFVEADEMPDAIFISDDYTIEEDIVKISMILVRKNKSVIKEIRVLGKMSEKEALTKLIISEAIRTVQK